jgi:hypothetical protein
MISTHFARMIYLSNVLMVFLSFIKKNGLQKSERQFLKEAQNDFSTTSITF